MSPRRALTPYRLVLALLLAMIGLQAMPSGAATFQPRQGSAFSSATLDVALVTVTRRIAETTAPALPHPQPLLPSFVQVTAATSPPSVGAPAPRPASTGPPRPAIHVVLHAPRAPPLL
ncbi:hypothetical protein [Sphingobium lignivorans]|uniref:Uncharacterized protein n=1 Tax=Sphingobium lignivorans TaxID=2735886 RepID=A0ABR6NI95_9SPHN|nr:hypothetical protein [Sphingobium lignivorans]MBB5987002.1 hypothetical protein [Sphingobium lignivorans]